MSFLPHKKFTWADFGGIYPDIPPSLRPCYLLTRQVPPRIFGYNDGTNYNDSVTIAVNYRYLLERSTRYRSTNNRNKERPSEAKLTAGQQFTRQYVRQEYSDRTAGRLAPFSRKRKRTNAAKRLLAVFHVHCMYVAPNIDITTWAT